MRVKLLEGLDEKKVIDIAHSLPYMNGAKHTILEMKKMGYKVVCFSGGFRVATSYAKNILGYDADFQMFYTRKMGNLRDLLEVI